MGHATRSVLEEIPGIDTPADLLTFWVENGLRADWHEPDNQGVEAIVYGDVLDNAMGSGWVPDDRTLSGEMNVILLVNGKREAVVNLANLLAWATPTGQRDGSTQ